MKKALMIILIVGACLLIVGGTIFVIAMSKAGWDFKALSNVSYEEKTATFSAEGINEIKVDVSTEDITFIQTDDDKITVEYFVGKNKKGEVVREVVPEVKDGVLSCVENKKKTFAMFDSYDKNLTIKVPENLTLGVSIELSTGDITFGEEGKTQKVSYLKIESSTGGVTIKNKVICEKDMSVKMTTGSLKINGEVECDGDVSFKASTGKITVDTPLKGKKVIVETTTGDIKIKKAIDFDSLDVTASTGDVTLYIAGKKEEYTYLCEMSTGKSNVSPFALGAKKINVHTSTGDIDIYFAE